MNSLDKYCWSLKRNFAVCGSVRTATFTAHDHPDTLLIHGINGSHYGCARLAQQLTERGRRPLLVDLPGHGDSGVPAWCDLASLRRWFSQLYAALSKNNPPSDCRSFVRLLHCHARGRRARRFHLPRAA